MKAAVVQNVADAAAQTSPMFVGENIVYLMGLSFVLGSLFTILILVLLDFMKRDRAGREPE